MGSVKNKYGVIVIAKAIFTAALERKLLGVHTYILWSQTKESIIYSRYFSENHRMAKLSLSNYAQTTQESLYFPTTARQRRSMAVPRREVNDRLLALSLCQWPSERLVRSGGSRCGSVLLCCGGFDCGRFLRFARCRRVRRKAGNVHTTPAVRGGKSAKNSVRIALAFFLC